MDFIDQSMRQAALYPRWLVITCAVVASLLFFWIVAKLLKWTVMLLLIFGLVIVLGGVLIGWLG